MKRIFLLCLLITTLAAAGAFAQVPQTMSYQGVLKDDAGVIVSNDNYDLTFKIYNVETSGSALWTEAQTIYVSAGIINAVLGAVTPIGLDFNEQYWLGVTIGMGSELAPRTRLTGVPYALNAQAVLGTDNVFPDSGSVGVGTTVPERTLHVVSNDLFVMEVEGTRPGSWATLSINSSSGGTPCLEYRLNDSYVAKHYVNSYHKWFLDLGAYNVLCADDDTRNVGVGGITDPLERLDVNGAVKLGTTDSTNAGTMRWTGADFEGYDGGTWLSLTAGGSGSLPPGSLGQTLRHNGTDWITSSLLYNDGTKIGVGTTIPQANMEVVGDHIGYHFRLTNKTTVGPALYLDASSKDWVIYGTNPGASAGDRKFIVRDYSAATDRLIIDENGNVGINEEDPTAPLTIFGGNWDLSGTDGDLRIGDDIHKFKIGVATGGLGAGIAGIRIQGGNEKLVLGAGLAEALWIENDGTVSIGSELQTGMLELYRNGASSAMMRVESNAYGGSLALFEENSYLHSILQADVQGTGGYCVIRRSGMEAGFTVDGNYGGTENPRVYITGSSRSASFRMDMSGDNSVVLPSSAISAVEIDNEAGCASNNAWDASGPALTGPDINVLTSRTITVPDAGFVLAISTAQVDIQHVYNTQSYAFFGVSDDSTAFPVCQDVMLQLSQYLPSGYFAFPVTNQSLFDVGGAGSYTFYQLAQEHSGAFQIFDSQLTLVYLPSAYGTVSTTAEAIRTAEEKGTAPLLSTSDIDAERLESIAANEARIERELAELRAQVEQMKREMETDEQRSDVKRLKD